MPDRPLDLVAELQALIAQVPRGRVTTCGAMADALGDRRAATWVGHYLLHHDHDADCHCHRIVRAGGLLGGYGAGSVQTKRELLEHEGVAIRNARIDLDCFGFCEFQSSHPLQALRDEQTALARSVKLRTRCDLPASIGGMDISYASPSHAVAAYTLVDTKSGDLVWSTTVSCPVTFPYIPTYLTYRELPALLAAEAAAREAGQLAELTLVDGTGILHPRRLGVATHFGIVADIATVGVTKALLCGRVEGEPQPRSPKPVFENEELLGAAIRPDENPKHTLFVSPGHNVDVATAVRAVEQTLRGRRLPEPIYWADRLSRAAAREFKKSLSR